MTTAKELRAQAQAARVEADAKRAEARALAVQARAVEAAECAAKRAKMQAAHSNQMFEKLGYELTRKQHDFIYAKAYEDGRRDGESGVEGQYSELADLVRACLGSASYL